MPPRLRYPELAPEGIAHMRALEHYLNASTALPAVLLELVRLRVSLLNGCEFCVGHHTQELHKHHEPDSRIEALRDWTSSDAFTPKERAALAWADSITEIQSRHAADEDFAAVSIYFHDKDLVDLTMTVASINAWNRLSIAFQSEWNPPREKQQLAGSEPESGGPGPSSAPVPAADTTADQSSAKSAQVGADSPVQDAVDDDGGKVAQD